MLNPVVDELPERLPILSIQAVDVGAVEFGKRRRVQTESSGSTSSMLHLGGTRPVIASEAKQSRERRGLTFPWIASSLTLLAMTIPSRSNLLSLPQQFQNGSVPAR